MRMSAFGLPMAGRRPRMTRAHAGVSKGAPHCPVRFISPCLRFCALVAAMEVERDSEEGAFVTEDVSAIIKEVRLPGRPTGPRQRSQGVP